jgi:hypothetical protein
VNEVATLKTFQNVLAKRSASARPHEHRRQQQREQEQDVVEGDPDVPHAFAHVVGERSRRERAAGSLRQAAHVQHFHGRVVGWPVAQRRFRVADMARIALCIGEVEVAAPRGVPPLRCPRARRSKPRAGTQFRRQHEAAPSAEGDRSEESHVVKKQQLMAPSEESTIFQ